MGSKERGIVNPGQTLIPMYPIAESNYSDSMRYRDIEECIGDTPLVKLKRLHSGPSLILCKLEGNNPAGSVKDRPAFAMIAGALASGRIRPGDTLIEATSGNTGIALAMAAAVKGCRMILIMPENMSAERIASMKAYGARVILTPSEGSMEASIDLARRMESEGKGIVLDQFANPDNPEAHYRGTGPEIWRDTDGKVTHFVASTGTTGTLMGTSRYLKERSPRVTIVGVRPDDEGGIPGIRAWPEAYLPGIYQEQRIDNHRIVSRAQAEETTRALAAREGIFAGISSGGNVAAALEVARELERSGTENGVIVVIICDRGDRYLSTGVFPA